MGESQNQNEKKQEDLEYSEILDKQLAEMLPDIHFNTITREEFAEYEGYKNQLAELKTKYEQKCVKFNELLQKSRELQEVYKTTTQENNKLKEKAKVQPQIID